MRPIDSHREGNHGLSIRATLSFAPKLALDGTIYSASWVENALPGATVTLVFAGPTGNSSTHSTQTDNNSLAELAFQENLTPALYLVAPRGVLGNVGPESASIEVDCPPLSRDGPPSE
jgi:hypothetical protein